MTEPQSLADHISEETLHADAAARRFLLAEHGFGLTLTGLLFVRDYATGAVAFSPAYRVVDVLPGTGWVWCLTPVLLGAVIVADVVTPGVPWRLLAFALAGSIAWYLVMAAMIAHGWGGNPHALYGPLGVYSLLLAPKAAAHLAATIRVGQLRDLSRSGRPTSTGGPT